MKSKELNDTFLYIFYTHLLEYLRGRKRQRFLKGVLFEVTVSRSSWTNRHTPNDL